MSETEKKHLVSTKAKEGWAYRSTSVEGWVTFTRLSPNGAPRYVHICALLKPNNEPCGREFPYEGVKLKQHVSGKRNHCSKEEDVLVQQVKELSINAKRRGNIY